MIAISAYAASVMTTTIADVMVIYATLPFVAAAIGFVVNRERVVAAHARRFGRRARRHRRHGRDRPRLRAASRAGAVGADDAGLRRHDRAAAAPAGRLDDRRQCGRRARRGRVRASATRRIRRSASIDLRVLFVFGFTTIGLAFVLFMEGAKLIPSAEAGLISQLDVVLGADLGVSCLRRESGRGDDSRRRARARGGALAHGAGSRAASGSSEREERMDERAICAGDGRRRRHRQGDGAGAGARRLACGARRARRDKLDEVAREIGSLGRRAIAPLRRLRSGGGEGPVRDDRAGLRPARPAVQQRRASARRPCRSTN